MGAIELKPCPFCGGEATTRTRISESIPTIQNAWVECKKCGAKGATFRDRDNTGSHIFSAIKAWNGRVAE